MKINIIRRVGGKTREIDFIKEYFPQDFKNYCEPCVGGGSVFLSMSDDIKHFVINDYSEYLNLIYASLRNNHSAFISCLMDINTVCKGITLTYEQFYSPKIPNICTSNHSQTTVIQQIEDLFQSIPSNFSDYNQSRFFDSTVFYQNCVEQISEELNKLSIKEIKDISIVDQKIRYSLINSFYNYQRHLLSQHKSMLSELETACVYLFLQEFCFGGYTRFNDAGEFRVSIDRNKITKNLDRRIEQLNSHSLKSKFQKTTVECMDICDFLKKKVASGDFAFIDPPYDTEDTEASTYDGLIFTQEKHQELAELLLEQTDYKWMIVIAKTPFILSLYQGKQGVFIGYYPNNYSSKKKKSEPIEHLVITNYPHYKESNHSQLFSQPMKTNTEGVRLLL